MSIDGTILLSRSEVAGLITHEECITAVEEAFRLHAVGEAAAPGILGTHAANGGFHVKTGILGQVRSYYVAKVNANFPSNMSRYGLPTIQGVIVVADAENGNMLALMDSIEITIIRTGAATAVAAKYLSRHDAKTAVIFGCGNQGRISLRMLMKIRALENIVVHDVNRSAAEKLCKELRVEFPVKFSIAEDIGAAVGKSDICITCTPSTTPFLKSEWIRNGTFIAAVGADAPDKQELESSMLPSAKVVVDIVDQCAMGGELYHAIEAGLMIRGDVYAELGEIISGRKQGRTSSEETFVFDSTGMALQDVAAASLVYENAVRSGAGTIVNFLK